MSGKFFKKSFAIIFLALSLAACGNESGQNGGSGDSLNTAKSPNAGNLPPPGSDPSAQNSNSSAEQNQGAIFFQRKELWDTFSTELKTQVQTNYGQSGNMLGSGPGGHGYYNSLFGRTSPNFSSSGGNASLP